MTVQENLSDINLKIESACRRSGRKPEDVSIVAVTKYVSIERAEEALEAGIHHLGENRLEGAMEKFDAIGSRAVWHFIGSLQSRKVKDMLHAYDYIHSLDRLSLAKEIQKRAEEGRTVSCFVQVNVSGEESKSGLDPEKTRSFIEELEQYPAVKVVGLMTMAPYAENPEEVRPFFQKLRELRNEIRSLDLPWAPCTELSMGMSNDLEIAVEEGATFVRLGSSLVGSEE
ncbi:YggS family pyridoxal phosphate-dependent enzyme [Alkalicoccus urumqiensis]|uniref:Pyridoxal phosphate homeostasis protein n=1 Tax=Alkalicoccus urumqiensis TaxID=1548213 RepID=A0A2P6MGE7_ALKUR|nr:YggS family pyridoxal phosphate-dependent enzyme [Alkalicoccus urumqiensis]PRO65310.1 YggS family pyridoxal phosphate-dependent enzyme [Alkalicoccus urumqiensis]